jgi:hypothetical protein
MNKETKTFLIIGAVIVIAVVIYFIITGKKGSASSSSTGSKASSNPISSAISKLSHVISPSNDNFPLKVGSSGNNVSNLQDTLNSLMTFSLSNQTAYPDYVPLSVDGDFGNLTLQAVQLYYGDANKTEVSESDYTALQSKLGTGYASAPNPAYEVLLGNLLARASLKDFASSQWEDNVLNMTVENQGV